MSLNREGSRAFARVVDSDFSFGLLSVRPGEQHVCHGIVVDVLTIRELDDDVADESTIRLVELEDTSLTTIASASVCSSESDIVQNSSPRPRR